MALGTVERPFACEMVDFLAPLPFDRLAMHNLKSILKSISTILKSISSSKNPSVLLGYHFKIHTDISVIE